MHTAPRSESRRFRRSGLVALTAAALAASIVVTTPQTADAAPGQVSGRVYLDYGMDGEFTAVPGPSMPTDRGLGGVTVTAYDVTGEAVDAATTQSDGTYLLELGGLEDGTHVRVEFSDLPERFEPSFAGAGNGTSVQFAVVGEEDVDFAVVDPAEYSNAGSGAVFPLVTPIAQPGLPTMAPHRPALVATPWGVRFGVDGQVGEPGLVQLATVGEVGSVWGTAYHRVRDELYVSAVFRRMAGLGGAGTAEDGLGIIYRMTDLLGADGTIGVPGAIEPWINLQGMPIEGGGVVDLGTVPANADRGLGGPDSPARDVPGFELAGRVGMGAIALSPDESTLYVVNLHDGDLYEIDVSDPEQPPATARRIPLDLPGGEQPWALHARGDQLYVGSVETGAPGQTAGESGMDAIVRHAALTDLGTWHELIRVDLDYRKGTTTNFSDVADHPRLTTWNGWVDSWNFETADGPFSVGRHVPFNGVQWGNWLQFYPQPILSDLQFDDEGVLQLAFTDRTSLQAGRLNLGTDPDDAQYYATAHASGDLLAAAPGPGGYVLESDGRVGDRSSAESASNQGPGGAEFFDDGERWDPAEVQLHQETALGTLARLAGAGLTAAAVYNPHTFNQVGLRWLDEGDGSREGAYALGQGDYAFAKGGGLGDLQLLLEAAPVQIGNRVWFDADQDGDQDPEQYEPPVEGVTVTLFDADGDALASRVTDAAGTYYFSSTDDDLAGLLVFGEEYRLEFSPPDSGDLFTDDPRFGTVPWSAVAFTRQDADDTADDTTDSDPDPATGELVFTLGGAGENDHDYDAGLVANARFEILKEIDGAGGAPAPGESYVIQVAGVDVEGADLELESPIAVAPGAVSPVITVPAGSRVTVTEAPDATVVSSTVDPTGSFLVPVTGQAPFRVTVTNLLLDEPWYDAGIQVIKYDGERPDPEIADGNGDWVTPDKPLDDPNQDANDVEHAVRYPVDVEQRVRWVVTNTGTTYLTDLDLSDRTDLGPAIGDSWTADLSAFGGPSDYSFVDDGPWPGLFPPGASFFAQGTLELPADTRHADTVTVVGTVVQPNSFDDEGNPEGPALDEDGRPIIALRDGVPWTLEDDDPFNAVTEQGPDLALTGATLPVAGLLLVVALAGAGTALLVTRRRRLGAR